MEASEQDQAPDQNDGSQDAPQENSGDVGQPQPGSDVPDTPQESQGEPAEDSNLETPQPDQPAQTEPERQAEGYKPRRLDLENAGLDQKAAEQQRQDELAAQREEHNTRTGDASQPKG